MKSRNGLMYLLIAGEIAILILIVALGVVKLMGGSKEPKNDYKPAESSNANVDQDIPRAPGQSDPPAEDDPQGDVGQEGTNVPENTDTREVFAEDVEAVLAEMTIEQKVAQLFIVSPETLTKNDPVTIAGSGTQAALQNYPVGGMVYSGKNYMGNSQIRDLLTKAQEMSHEQSGRYLFAGIAVEGENGTSFTVAKIGQEEQLGGLLKEDAKVNEETTADFIKFPLYQELSQLTGAQGPDALGCYRVGQNGRDAVQALQSGADMLCVTDGFEDVYQTVLAAANSQEIPQTVLDRAVGKILTEKKSISGQEEGNE